jgi:pimeloyl-ACP methyl ester carboxylesterase
MLMHGLGATGRLNWSRCFQPLAQHFRVLTVDQRGHGRGLRTRRFSLEECADDAAAVASELGARRFMAVGYSMGGPIAALAWRRHPKRVSGLVLCATARRFASRPAARVARVALPMAALAARFVPGAIHRLTVQRLLAQIEHPELRARVRDELLGHEPATVIQAAEALTRFSSTDWIGKVDVPARGEAPVP